MPRPLTHLDHKMLCLTSLLISNPYPSLNLSWSGMPSGPGNARHSAERWLKQRRLHTHFSVTAAKNKLRLTRKFKARPSSRVFGVA